MLLSHTLYHRADGTISGVVRRETVTFTGPKGEAVQQEVETPVTLADITDILGAAYASFDAHNKTLEAQIATERETAETEKQRIAREAAEALAAKDEVIAQKDAELAAERAKAASAEAVVSAEAVKQ